jgi:hypothetical protein
MVQTAERGPVSRCEHTVIWVLKGARKRPRQLRDNGGMP